MHKKIKLWFGFAIGVGVTSNTDASSFIFLYKGANLASQSNNKASVSDALRYNNNCLSLKIMSVKS